MKPALIVPQIVEVAHGAVMDFAVWAKHIKIAQRTAHTPAPRRAETGNANRAKEKPAKTANGIAAGVRLGAETGNATHRKAAPRARATAETAFLAAEMEFAKSRMKPAKTARGIVSSTAHCQIYISSPAQ